MTEYTLQVIDVKYPWELTKGQLAEATEIETAFFEDDDDAIEWAEDFGSADLTWEWARVTLKKGSRTIWKRHDH